MTYTYNVRAGKKGLSPKYPVIEGAYSLDITVPGETVLYDSRTDPATGETVTCKLKSDTLTVSGDVSASSPVCVALFDENGRLTSIEMMDAPGTADVGTGVTAKLIWLNADGFTAKSESMDFELS